MNVPRLIRLPAALEKRLRQHCEERYPHESCGALIGSGDGTDEPWRVAEVRPAPNAHGDDRTRRYLIPPEFQLQAEHDARRAGQDVIGFYHSHPDHPARPSEYDRAHAWPGYVYAICAVQGGTCAELGFFAIEPSGGFVPLAVLDSAP